MTPTDGDPDDGRAHLKAVRDFFYHLTVFAFVTALLAVVDIRGGKQDGSVAGLDWAYWIILFWGFALSAHAVWAFLGDHRLRNKLRE
ncbi:2TM domain-containing protein [Nocardioides sp. GY 10113]|uniref:2TM domain-containing protein n=1 Tax=Nocardioides sp. GY 10113 TaxID=2569761 RepID=UPI0010A87614|nr:2TM domain-containing protein [Nocardioides sp. GY 10113]TIC81331.1 2TM domain-containing protein [Nocardioides sp. GY 10113]